MNAQFALYFFVCATMLYYYDDDADDDDDDEINVIKGNASLRGVFCS